MILPQYTLERVELPTENLGSIYGPNGEIICKTVELPWRLNEHNISCIPLGKYKVVKEATSPKHEYGHFRVIDVPGRNGILLHRITYVKDLRGCIGIAGKFFDLNKDGVPDAIESGVTLQKMFDILPDEFELTIKKK